MSELLSTERVDPRSANLDTQTCDRLVAGLIAAQRDCAEVVASQAGPLAQAVEQIVLRLREGGRLHYVGAGTSGRLGVLDASEVPPTFGAPASLVCAHIAGGEPAIRQATEGAEDDAASGRAELREHVLPGDAVVALSASGGAAFVCAAAEYAREIGAWTVAITSNRGSVLARTCDCSIVLETGAEPIAGSTRMRAGTAQKIALNTISTAVMVRLGKVYDNLMVDVVVTNEKLRRRAVRLVADLAATDEAHAEALLREAGGSVKVAVVMARCSVQASTARDLLQRCAGSLRDALRDNGT